MNYRVLWRIRAEAQLASLWLRAADKDALTDCSEAIDRILARDPHSQGEGRQGNACLWFYRPLCVLCLVDDPAKTVHVAAIKWVGW